MTPPSVSQSITLHSIDTPSPGLVPVFRRLFTVQAKKDHGASPRIIVVGGGFAGLAAVIKIAEAGGTVDLFSIVPVKRSHSVCAQGGINAAKNLKGEGDTTDKHFDDTIYGGDFLANQTPVKAMCEAAPGIIDLLDRMGVPFNRTPEGLLDFRRFGGTLYNRTAFAGATTGQQLLYALDEQVRRYESDGKVKKYEGWEFLSAVLDSKGIARGITALDLRTMELRSFPAGAVILATGGIGAIFGKSTNSVVCTGSAQSAVFQQGAYYANGEFVQVHPTAIPGEDKLRLMSESARGEGGRIWVPRKFPVTRAPSRKSPSPSASISSKSGSQNTATSSPATSPPAPSTKLFMKRAWASTASPWSISISHTSTAPPSTASSKASSRSTKNSSATIPATCP
jgi:succinate dehydrogenase/fumarate reductase flavoprotein subunit